MDPLSSLPDVPLVRILSFLSLRDVSRLAGVSPLLWHHRSDLLLDAALSAQLPSQHKHFLDVAVRAGNVLMLRWLYRKKSTSAKSQAKAADSSFADKMSQLDGRWKAAVMTACRTGKAEATAYLAHHVSPAYRAEVLTAAVRRGHVDVVRRLLAEGKEGKRAAPYDSYPRRSFEKSFFLACTAKNVAVARLFLVPEPHRIESQRGLWGERVHRLKLEVFFLPNQRDLQDDELTRMLLSSAPTDGGVGITTNELFRECLLVRSSFRNVANWMFRPKAEGGLGYAPTFPERRLAMHVVVNKLCKLVVQQQVRSLVAFEDTLDYMKFWLTPLEAGGPGLTTQEVRESNILVQASYVTPELVKHLLTSRTEGGAGLTSRDAAWLLMEPSEAIKTAQQYKQWTDPRAFFYVSFPTHRLHRHRAHFQRRRYTV